MTNEKLLKNVIEMIQNHIDNINSGNLGIAEIEYTLNSISALSKLLAENYWNSKLKEMIKTE